jgi:hypothetical protein
MRTHRHHHVFPRIARFALIGTACAFALPALLSAQCWSPIASGTSLAEGRAAAGAVKDNFGNIYLVGGNLPLATATVRRFREVNGQLVDTTNAAPAMPLMATPRAEHAVARDRLGRIYVFGGLNNTAPFYASTCERYDPITNEWATIAPLPSLRGYVRAAASLDGMSIFVMGGQSPTSTMTNTVFRYDVASGSWSTDNAMLFPRTVHGVAVGKDGTIYAVGGNESLSFSGVWHQLPSPPAFLGQAAACFADSSGRIHVMAAYQFGSWLPHTTHEIYDPALGTWTTCSPDPTPLNNIASVLSDEGRLYLLGGQTFSTVLTDVREVPSAGRSLFTFTQHAGAGSVDIRIVNGHPLNLALTVVTLNPANNATAGRGGLGTGWWGGLHASWGEILGFWGSGAPFLMQLDASGSARWSAPAGTLSSLAGLTFFASNHTFDPFFVGFSGASYPAAITIR